jgi:hypothetical protein
VRRLATLNKVLAHRPWALDQTHLKELTTGQDSWSLAEIVQAIGECRLETKRLSRGIFFVKILQKNKYFAKPLTRIQNLVILFILANNFNKMQKRTCSFCSNLTLRFTLQSRPEEGGLKCVHVELEWR